MEEEITTLNNEEKRDGGASNVSTKALNVKTVTDSSITITWEKIPDDRIPADEIRYIVKLYGLDNLETPIVEKEERGIDSYEFTDLKPATTYKFYVEAYDVEDNKLAEYEYSYHGETTIKTLPSQDKEPPKVNPKSLTLDTTDNSITVSWEKASDDVTTAEKMLYRVGIYKYDNRQHPEIIEIYGINTYTFTGLEPNTEYRVFVEACDVAGNSSRYTDDDDDFLAITAPTAPVDNKAPQVASRVLTVTRVTDTGFAVSWEKALDDMTVADKIRYIVRLYGLDNLETPIVEKEEWGISSFEFTGLKPATEYKFYVEAYDEAGNCVRYPDDNGYVTATTAEEKDTEAPQLLSKTISVDVSPNSITLSWQPATDNKTAFSDILYTIKMCKGMSGSSSDWVELVSKSGITSYTAKDLDPNAIYSFMVTAKDKSNNEVNYNVMVIKTMEEKDTEAPRVSAKAISMTNATSNSITIEWQAATDNKIESSSILYVVKMKKIVDGTSGSWAELESKEGITSYTAKNLDPNTSYLFMVTAKDASGNETDYESVVYKTLEEKDIEAPQVSAKAIRMTDTTSNSITIEWQAATDNKTDSQNIVYTIKMKKIVSGTSSDWVEIESKKGINSYTAKDLDPNTFYSFMVSAKDESGNEIDYNSVDIQTAGERDTEAPRVSSKEIRWRERTPISIPIEWDPATDNKTAQSEIEYSVYKCKIVPGEEEKRELFIERKKGITSCEVTGLDFLNADYRFYVKAYDSAGNCIEYESDVVNRLELSDCIGLSTSSIEIRCTKQTPNSITIGWEPAFWESDFEPDIWEPSPDTKTALSEIEYSVYKAKVTSNGKEERRELFVEHLKNISCEVTNLEPNTRYRFFVEAFSPVLDLWLSYKDSEYFSTLEGKDTEAPQVSSMDIQATNITPESINIAWQAAIDNKTAPSEILYEVYVNKGTSGRGEKKYSWKGFTTCMITGLEPNTQYCFTVVAKDTSGNETVYNSAVYRTAVEKDMNAPVISSNVINATNITTNSITLSWQAATDNKTSSTEILYYVYQGTTCIKSAKGITSHVVTGLSPKTRYSFYVEARDNSGNVTRYVTKVVETKDTVAPIATDALPYNPTNLRIVKETNDWLLTDGRSRMLIFATEEDAMNGLKVVKRYTRHCFIGRSNKRSNRKDFIFEYWEGNSGLPVEKLSKSDIIPYDPKKVSARFNAKAGYWEIIEEISASFTHGMFIADNEADAKAMLSVIKRYSKLCFIGRDNKKSNRKDYIMHYFE